MPVVAGMGGNAATQTLTVIVRGIALGELTWANTRKALLKEAAVGIANGVGCGVVAGLVVWMWKGSPGSAASSAPRCSSTCSSPPRPAP